MCCAYYALWSLPQPHDPKPPCGLLRRARLSRVLKRSTDWEIDIAIDGKTRKCAASLIVDATGRAAAFARSQGAKIRAHDRQIAVVAFEDGSNNDNRSLVETAEIGWWYSAPVGPARSVCMLITDDDLLPRGAHSDLCAWWLDHLNRTNQLANRFRKRRAVATIGRQVGPIPAR